MFRGLVASAHRLLAELSQHRSPDRIAWGMALGTSFGFIPMDNLVSALLLLSILFLPIHQLSAAGAWIATSLVGGVLAGIPETLGSWLLSLGFVQWLVCQCHALPLGPWLRLNNTLVLGGLAFGLMTLIPNWISWRFFARRARDQFVTGLLSDMAENATAYRKASSDATQSPVAAPVPMSMSSASEELEVEPTPPSIAMGSLQDIEQVESLTLQETFIEVVRLRASLSHFSVPAEVMNNTMILETETASAPQTMSDSVSACADASTTAASVPYTTRCSPAHTLISGPKSSNSLQYLLRHLATHRDSQASAESHV
jgi:uncharacterized protein (TIGR03546 family)